MISLDEFKDYLLFIREHRVKEEALMEALEALCPENHCDCFLYSQYEEKIINLLKEILNDRNNEIDYFVYDLNGLENKSLVVEDKMKCPTYELKDGGECMLYYSADTLYEYLTRYQK